MITEDYVSFETAKLLKEKEFNYDVNCTHAYVHGKVVNKDYVRDINELGEFVQAPTLQMAMKWLREEHNLHIDVPITYQYLPRKYEAHIMHTEKYEDIVVNPGTNFNTNEEACEAAIKYCLENLI